jgi:hypothetical protein
MIFTLHQQKSISIIEAALQDNERRWFPSKFLNTKDKIC